MSAPCSIFFLAALSLLHVQQRTAQKHTIISNISRISTRGAEPGLAPATQEVSRHLRALAVPEEHHLPGGPLLPVAVTTTTTAGPVVQRHLRQVAEPCRLGRDVRVQQRRVRVCGDAGPRAGGGDGGRDGVEDAVAYGLGRAPRDDDVRGARGRAGYVGAGGGRGGGGAAAVVGGGLGEEGEECEDGGERLHLDDWVA